MAESAQALLAQKNLSMVSSLLALAHQPLFDPLFLSSPQDVWSDDVAIASKMESTGEPNKIQISSAARLRLKLAFRLTEGQSVDLGKLGRTQTFIFDPGERVPPSTLLLVYCAHTSSFAPFVMRMQRIIPSWSPTFS